jgi:3-keto-5-aminohexanoate cleavage enzyme
MSEFTPMMIAVAPNGARKTATDHPTIPLTPEALADTALRCFEAGACMIHLHVRDDDQGHSLDVERYEVATAAIRSRVGSGMIIQITTEAVGIYQPSQQMKVVRDLKPEAVSLAIRELCAEEDDEEEAALFFHWLWDERIAPQYILYSPEDVTRFAQLRQKGVIPAGHRCVLYVLGRYSESGNSSAQDLLPFLAVAPADVIWSVCAFGSSELCCMLSAAGLGGHCRVGFENNTTLASGDTAPDNRALVAQIATGAAQMERRVMTAAEARVYLGMA